MLRMMGLGLGFQSRTTATPRVARLHGTKNIPEVSAEKVSGKCPPRLIYTRPLQRAFAHLQRSIVVDAEPRAKWQKAFDNGEAECEKLSAVHRLLHGIWAFKINASDQRGCIYALTELADRVRHGGDVVAALTLASPYFVKPANPIRSIARAFVSEVEDKPVVL